MRVLEWLFITIAPCDAAEPCQLANRSMIDWLFAQLSSNQMFWAVLFLFGFTFILLLTLILYLRRLLNVYSQIMREVFSFNQKFGKPISFQYSWLKGVKIGVSESETQEGEREKKE